MDRRTAADDALRSLLPRLAGRLAEIEQALRTHDGEPDHTTATAERLGRRLAARYPELESLAAAIGRDPEEMARLAAEAELAPGAISHARAVVEMVESSPTLSSALRAAFPHVTGPAHHEQLVVLVGDPLVDGNDRPVRPGGRPRWPIPWRQLESRLTSAVARSGKALDVSFHPATWTRALELVPRARYLIVLCHGSPDSLAFEQWPAARLWHLTVPDRIRTLFASAATDVAVVLACHGENAARAMHEAGVPLAVAISDSEPLSWQDAIVLVEGFVTAFLAGAEAGLAFRQAAAGTAYADSFVVFGSEGRRLRSRVPAGEPEAPAPALMEHTVRPGFSGRERELSQLMAAMELSGLTIVHGAPGQGKTELARALLERCRLTGVPAAGSVFISLEGATSADAVLRSVVAATPGADDLPVLAIEPVGRLLGAADRLVVLDNAEDALEAAATRSTLKALITAVLKPGLGRVVVTTRRKLAWPGPASRLRLGVLDTEAEAVALLRGIVCESTADDAHEAWRRAAADRDLARLVAALGRHPLSLRLAAGILAEGVPARAVLEDLQATGSLDGDIDADERDASLRASLGLSSRRLESAEPGAGQLWRAVAELVGGHPATARLPEVQQRHLRALFERGLVELEAGGYVCLPPIRAYLRRHLPAPREWLVEELRRSQGEALANMLAEATKRIGTAESSVAVAVLSRWWPAIDARLGDARQADEWRWPLMAHAVRLASYAGVAAIAFPWVDAARWSGRPCPAEADARLCAGDLAMREDRLDEARQHYDQALDAFGTIGARLGEANTLQGLAGLAMAAGEPRQAIELGRRAAGMSLAIGDRLGATGALAMAARGHLRVDEEAQAVALLLGVRRLARESRSFFNEAVSLQDLSLALQAVGQDELASATSLASAVMLQTLRLPVPESLRELVDRLESEGKASEVVNQVNRALDNLVTRLENVAAPESEATRPEPASPVSEREP